jgi:hypothetical protein
MNLSDKYRTCTDTKEILRILQKASTMEGNFFWQTLNRSSQRYEKIVTPVFQFEIDFIEREVVVYFSQNEFSVDHNLPLYFKLEHRESVFKVTQFRVSPSVIKFHFPKEIKTLELRHQKRRIFSAENLPVAIMRPSLGTQNEFREHELHVRLNDISPQGLGLRVSDSNRLFLKNNRILWLSQIGDRSLDTPLLAEVVYMKNDIQPSFGLNKQKDIQVGIKLSQKIPEDIYNKFVG